MTPLAPVAADAAMKFVSGKVVHHLGEDGAAGVHAPLSAHRLWRHRRQRQFKSKMPQVDPNCLAVYEFRPVVDALAGQ